MRRRHACLALGACVTPAVAVAQPTRRPARIAWLAGLHFDAFAHRGVFVEAMRSLGWHEGRHYVVESFSYEGYADRIPALAAEIVASRPDVILAGSTPTVGPLQKASSTLPIVFFSVGDPVRSGFVDSLARPGRNATGLGGLGYGLVGKSLEILNEAVPRLRRFGVAHHPELGPHADNLHELDAAAARLGIGVHKVAMRSPDDLEDGFATLAREQVQALALLGQPWQLPRGARLAALCLRHRLPACTLFQEVAHAGVLMAYGWRLVDLMRRAPWFVVRILQGAAPAELPVEQPSRFYLTLNLKTARTLGLELPSSLQLRADEVIE